MFRVDLFRLVTHSAKRVRVHYNEGRAAGDVIQAVKNWAMQTARWGLGCED